MVCTPAVHAFTVEQQVAASMIQATERRRMMRSVNAMDGKAKPESSCMFDTPDLQLPLTSTLRTLKNPEHITAVKSVVVQRSIVDPVALHESDWLPLASCDSRRTVEEQQAVPEVHITAANPSGNMEVRDVHSLTFTPFTSSATNKMLAPVESSIVSSAALSEILLDPSDSLEASAVSLLGPPCATLTCPSNNAGRTRTSEIAAAFSEASAMGGRLVSRLGSLLCDLLRCPERVRTSKQESVSSAEDMV